MPDFIPGLDLAQAYYEEVVAAIVGPTTHSAAAVGWGSDIIGFDTERSTDHGWGPRLHVFVAAADVEPLAARIDKQLPDEFRGWPTRFGWDDHPVQHHVTVVTLGSFLANQVGFDPRVGISTRDWLLIPQQRVLHVTGGRVFHDGLAELVPVRKTLEWYPDEVWLWLLACQWQRLSQEEAFVGRTAEVGDEIGSRVVAARVARDLIRLCFLIERTYAPYSKWLGSAFAALESAAEVRPSLERALVADRCREREDGLVAAYEAVARRFNRLGLVDELDPSVRPFYGRPFLVIHADRFAAACRAAITDEWLRSLPLVGSVDQFADSTDVLSHGRRPRRLGALYDEEG